MNPLLAKLKARFSRSRPEREFGFQTDLSPALGSLQGQPAPARLRLPGLSRKLKRLLLATLGVLLALEVSGALLATCGPSGGANEAGGQGKKKSLAALQAETEQLQRKIKGLGPSGLYVVVDTAGNRVLLKRGETTVKDMLASCGSGNVLEDPVGGRTWVFDTPRGDFRIQKKVTKPVWVKPDWAFLEEGEPIPERSSERSMPGMMGDYALGIGDGYYLHGTLYSRLLGRNVSHGCVRLGDADLEELYRSADIGTRVLIY